MSKSQNPQVLRDRERADAYGRRASKLLWVLMALCAYVFVAAAIPFIEHTGVVALWVLYIGWPVYAVLKVLQNTAVARANETEMDDIQEDLDRLHREYDAIGSLDNEL